MASSHSPAPRGSWDKARDALAPNDIILLIGAEKLGSREDRAQQSTAGQEQWVPPHPPAKCPDTSFISKITEVIQGLTLPQWLR